METEGRWEEGVLMGRQPQKECRPGGYRFQPAGTGGKHGVGVGTAGVVH